MANITLSSTMASAPWRYTTATRQRFRQHGVRVHSTSTVSSDHSHRIANETKSSFWSRRLKTLRLEWMNPLCSHFQTQADCLWKGKIFFSGFLVGSLPKLLYMKRSDVWKWHNFSRVKCTSERGLGGNQVVEDKDGWFWMRRNVVVRVSRVCLSKRWGETQEVDENLQEDLASQLKLLEQRRQTALCFLV